MTKPNKLKNNNNTQNMQTKQQKKKHEQNAKSKHEKTTKKTPNNSNCSHILCGSENLISITIVVGFILISQQTWGCINMVTSIKVTSTTPPSMTCWQMCASCFKGLSGSNGPCWSILTCLMLFATHFWKVTRDVWFLGLPHFQSHFKSRMEHP
jgi:hypothetical protein